MATQKPTSTISYNTESFLKEKLEGLYKAHIIQAYSYIVHKGEDGDKDHIHLRVEPNKKLDVMTLAEEFVEYVQNNDKPLRCRPFRPSKEEDWLLYAVHDPEYMKLKYPEDKGEKLPYSWKEIIASPLYDVETAFIRAKSSLKHGSSNLLGRLRQGERPATLIAEGENPFTINAVFRTLQLTDYERLQEDYANLKCEFGQLVDLVNKLGYVVDVRDDGSMFLHKGGTVNRFSLDD